MKVRIKSVELEAFQYDGNYMNCNKGTYFPWWAVDAFETGVIYYYSINGEPCELFVMTPRGCCTINIGDYVVKDNRGDLYVYKEDVFEKNYERIGE